MRQQKDMKRCMLMGTILFFILALLIHFSPPIPTNIQFVSGHRSFWENICLGGLGGFFVGYISSYIMIQSEKQKMFLYLIRKVKWIENTLIVYLKEIQHFLNMQKRLTEIDKNIQQAKESGDSASLKLYREKFQKEEMNIRISHEKSKDVVQMWMYIYEKAQDLKEDYSFMEIQTKNNKSNIDQILQLLFNIEKTASDNHALIASGTDVGAYLSAYNIKFLHENINKCLESLIEVFVPINEQQKMKDSYIIHKDFDSFIQTVLGDVENA